jgi:diaminobutyrate-2-oxoglutarate transaminase
MIGIECITDRESRRPNPELVKAIRESCLRKGLLFEVGGHFKNVIRLVPPLIITPLIIDNAVEILSRALDEVALAESAL